MKSLPSNIATIHKAFLTENEANDLFQLFLTETTIQTRDEIRMPDGSVLHTDTGKCMFVDEELTDTQKFVAAHGRRVQWPEWLVPLRNKLEEMLKMEFNVCVGLYYPNGGYWMDYHHDDPAFGCTSIVPSLSLGAPRIFSLREAQNHGNVVDIPLKSGDMVIMREHCQSEFQHAVLSDEEIKSARINLTFRPFRWSKATRKSKVRY